jgi:hypothetical protein
MAAHTIPPARQNLANGLTRMRELQTQGNRIFQSADLTRAQREALESAGFLRRVIKGWYIASRPGESLGDTTAWHASLREFIGSYCNHRFGNDWYLSPDASVLVHAGVTVLPRQVIVMSDKAQRNRVELLGGNSLFDSTPAEPTGLEQIVQVGPLRVLSLPLALTRVPEVFYRTYPVDAQIALRQLRTPADLLRILLSGGHSFIAGRLAGAFRANGLPRVADDIAGAMAAAGYRVTELNPFQDDVPSLGGQRVASPYVDRIRIMWSRMRNDVVQHFPPEPGRPANAAAYLHAVAEAYQADAYHSLSIEGYAVSDALIARVSQGDWNPDGHSGDAEKRNAMVAHGYYLAHAAVRASLAAIIAGENPGVVVERDHAEWYRQLFRPTVTAGMIAVEDLAGYRNDQVFIRNADHVPPDKTAVWDMMPTLFELLKDEPSAAARAVLGHFVFVFIHPYMDGNGRTGRFLMNAMLASGGYPWTVIPVARRPEYLAALNAASGHGNIVPFTQFLASCVGVSQSPQ